MNGHQRAHAAVNTVGGRGNPKRIDGLTTG